MSVVVADQVYGKFEDPVTGVFSSDFPENVAFFFSGSVYPVEMSEGDCCVSVVHEFPEIVADHFFRRVAENGSEGVVYEKKGSFPVGFVKSVDGVLDEGFEAVFEDAAVFFKRHFVMMIFGQIRAHGVLRFLSHTFRMKNDYITATI
jgi:hypothetical protein